MHRSKDSPARLQAELTRESRRLEVAETDLGLLKGEQGKMEAALRQVNDSSLDPMRGAESLKSFLSTLRLNMETLLIRLDARRSRAASSPESPRDGRAPH